MTIRYARHTYNLHNIEQFYTQIIGLENLGIFLNHNGYDGLFLGYASANWHLEFTVSADVPQNNFDADDALVFYVNSTTELTNIKNILNTNNIEILLPKNPYWTTNGILIKDPDGYNIIFSIKEIILKNAEPLSNLIINKGLRTWSALLEYTIKLPYGRNFNRHDVSLVITENKGTCSSKHALLKTIADLNDIKNVQLIVGIYKMNSVNMPKIGSVLTSNGLDYIPEAHCYLKINNKRIDLTTITSNIENLQKDIMEEIEITPEQVATFKVDYHKKYITNWIKTNNIPLNLDNIWNIREECISLL